MNTKEQGAIGVAKAIAYYAQKGYAVFVPVSDVSRFDLVVDSPEGLMRVEVKTTTRLNGRLDLRTMGGNQSWSGEVARISAERCDLVLCFNLVTGAVREFPASYLDGRATVKV